MNYILFGQNAGNIVRTLVDISGTQNWSEWTTTYNNNFEILSTSKLGNDGLSTLVVYDIENSEDWATRVEYTDTADIFDWDASYKFINDTQETMLTHVFYDNGLSVLTEYDLDGEYDWARKVTRDLSDGFVTEYFYDDDGVLYDTIVG